MKRKLTGYIRDDNRIGFRNHIAVIPLAGCTQRIADRIADKVPQAVAFFQPLGCDLLGPDQQRFGNMLYQLAAGPNVGGVVFLTLGCAAANDLRLPAKTKETDRPVKIINLQQTGGTSACIAAGVKAVKEIAKTLESQKRCEVSLSSIVLGTKCGASDKSSFELCHPVVGHCCDMLVDIGAAVVLSEDHELYPAMDSLADRAVDETAAKELYAINQRLKADTMNRTGVCVDKDWEDREKAHTRSLGHIAKAGTRPIQKVIPRGQLIGDDKGLLVLDAPNSDLIVITSLAAAGCNLLAFTTGCGTLTVFPTVPTIKITANEKTFTRMNENIDFLVKNKDSAKELLELVIAVANGKPTKGELTGHGEMFTPIDGVTF